MKKLLTFVWALTSAGIFAAVPDGPQVMNFWMSPASPVGIWTPHGGDFPAEKIIETAAAAGATDMDICFDGDKHIYYTSKVIARKRVASLPENCIERLLAAAAKHKIRVWAVITPAAQVQDTSGKTLYSTSAEGVVHWQKRIAEIGERFKKNYPDALAGIVLHEINRPETGNPHTGELQDFSEFCRKEFGEAYSQNTLPDGRDGTLWNRRFNLYRVDRLNHWSKTLIDEAARYGMKTSFINYDPEAHYSFSAAWGYDTLFYEKYCHQVWGNENSYQTLKNVYLCYGPSYRGQNVPVSFTKSFHPYSKNLFEFRTPFFPEIMQAFYKKDKKFTSAHGDFLTGYSRKSPTTLKLFFGKDQAAKTIKAMNYWYGAKPLARIGVVASSLPNILRNPVNPGNEYSRCVTSVYDAVRRHYGAVKLLAGSLITLDPEELRKNFDCLILPENQSIGMTQDYIDSLKRYQALGGKLLGIASPVTVAKRDLTQSKEVTGELFGITVTPGKLPGFVRLNGKKVWSNSTNRVVGQIKNGTAFIPVSYSDTIENILISELDNLLAEPIVKLEQNNNFILHSIAEKNNVICLALVAEKKAAALLKAQLPDNREYCLRNLLTGDIIAQGNAELFSRGIKISTIYDNEPYVLILGPKSRVEAFKPLFASRKEFAGLNKITMAIQNPEVPLLIPGKPGLKVGICMSTLGAEKIFDVLSQLNGINAYLIPRLDEPCVNASDVVIVPQLKNKYYYKEAIPLLRRAMQKGKGVIIIHNAIDTAHEDYPEVFSGKSFKHTMLTDATLKNIHNVKFQPGFKFDHYDLALKPGALIMARSIKNKPVIAIASFGQGKLGIFGTLAGHFGELNNGAGTSEGTIQGEEKALLIEMIKKAGNIK